jgi:hypothetical protein
MESGSPATPAILAAEDRGAVSDPTPAPHHRSDNEGNGSALGAEIARYGGGDADQPICLGAAQSREAG